MSNRSFIVLALCAACGNHADATSNEPAPPENKVHYELATVGQAPPHWTEDIPARIMFDETHTSRVGAPLGGRVSNVLVELGQRVKTGAVLVTVTSGDLADLYSARNKAKVELDSKQLTYNNVKAIVDLGSMPKKELIGAEQNLKEAQVALATANSKIASLKVGAGGDTVFSVNAPRDGVIVEKNVAVGQQVSPDNGSILAIADLSDVWVVTDLLEDAVDDIKAGSKAQVLLDGVATPLEGTVDQVASIVDPDRHTVPVRVKLENPAGALRPNALAQVRFYEEQVGPLSVPAEALLTDGATDYVYVVRNGTPRRQDVVAGPRNAKVVPIRSGLAAGDQVVARGAVLLDNQLPAEQRQRSAP